MANPPDIVLVGSGVGDSLQITVDAQRMLGHVGLAYGLGVRSRLARHLRASGIQLVPLDDRLIDRPPELGYLSIAQFVLQQAQLDPPAVLIVPGNPLLSNSICRFIAARGKELKLGVQVLAAVSPIDSVVNATGLDVGAFGLQVFDARRLVSRRQRIDPSVPLILLQPAALAAGFAGEDAIAACEGLAVHLRGFYPPTHAVALLSDALGGGPSIARATVDRVGELVRDIGSSSTLFIDLVRPSADHPFVSRA